MNKEKSLVMILDDEPEVRKLIGNMIEREGYKTMLQGNPAEALKELEKTIPDLIILDIRMPEMEGYEFCSRLQKHETWSYIPVIFLTALTSEQDRAKAFASGGVDFLTKPVSREDLMASVHRNIKIHSEWNAIQEIGKQVAKNKTGQFVEFKDFLVEKLALDSDKKNALAHLKSKELFNACSLLDLSTSELAHFLSEFTGWDYCPYISPENLQLGKLPAPFCRKSRIIPIKDSSGHDAFVIANPFDVELFDLVRTRFEEKTIKFLISDYKAVDFLLSGHEEGASPSEEMAGLSAVEIADNILYAAISQRASDIHIEPKESHIVVRFRVDGDMKGVYALKSQTGVQVISRLKVLAGMDIAEKRKPQDGALEMAINNATFKLRLATTSTPHGESMIIRLLDPNIKPKSLNELGMTDEQVKTLMDFAARDRGFVLVVGPTGSGKTTTIYSLLAQVDCKTRSLCSVEDPVEYRIPFANQQQVNEKAGITFESVLKSAMRQDPDVLFLGEVRDPFSAKASLDFASTGHLTITTLHTSNATTAIFRLERLGATRSVMADTLLGIVAQRLLKKLCEHCKKVGPPTDQEREMLKLFMEKMPEKVANPVGCVRCNHTGYFGREGVYEIITFDPEISKMIRNNRPISEIRDFMRRRGSYLISHHAVDKMRQLKFSPKDIYEKVLVEEPFLEDKKTEVVVETPAVLAAPKPTAQPQAKMTVVNSARPTQILLVEDSKDNRDLVSLYLRKAGYAVTESQDGVEALLQLGHTQFDLIVSDIDMPNLDGFKLIEMLTQKGISTPVLFITAKTSEEDEVKGFALGAADFIKKPIKKEILLMRVQKALKNIASTAVQEAA